MMKVFFKLISYIIVFIFPHFLSFLLSKNRIYNNFCFFLFSFKLRNKSNKFHCTENKVKRCQTQSVYITDIKTSIKISFFWLRKNIERKVCFIYIASKVNISFKYNVRLSYIQLSSCSMNFK